MARTLDPTLESFTPKPFQKIYMEEIFPHLKVSDSITQTSRAWDIQKLQSLFNEESMTEIQKISISQNLQRQDSLIWSPNQLGRFSVYVKTTYHIVAKVSKLLRTKFSKSCTKETLETESPWYTQVISQENHLEYSPYPSKPQQFSSTISLKSEMR